MKYLLPKREKYFKTNLHCHSTVSDGRLSPEELKAEYQKRGYSVVAFTDHEVCFSHQDLNDDNFLTLTGYEMITNQWDIPAPHFKTYHFNFIAKDPDNTWQIYNPKYREASRRHMDKIVCDGYEDREYDLEKMNEIIARHNEKGFLVTYNHPIWSMQERQDYIGLKGLWGVEVFNGECFMLGYDDYMNQPYQELLKAGNCLVPLATDDTHSPRAIGMGWIMVGAEKLTYPAVIEALEKGDLYASTGPEIHSLTLEGNVLRLTCSEAVTVNLQPECRRGQRIVAAPGETLTEAEFDLSRWLDDCEAGREKDAFIRICITDASGHKAFTRAYWRTELFGD